MHTLKLKVNDQVYEKLMVLLSKFNKDEIEVISEDPDFNVNQTYLRQEYNEIIAGKATFIDIQEAELKLDAQLKK